MQSGSHNITLSGVSITSSGGSPFSIQSGAAVNLTLVGDNSLICAGDWCAGLYVPAGAKLTITKQSTGSLYAQGGFKQAADYSGTYAGAGAGIGGDGGAGGTVTIRDHAIVTASGDAPHSANSFGAGIGGGTGNSSRGALQIIGDVLEAKAGAIEKEAVSVDISAEDNGAQQIHGKGYAYIRMVPPPAVLNVGATADLPQTGDPSSLMGWAMLLGASAAAMKARRRK